MMINDWRLSGGKAFWMEETAEDSEGNTYTIAIVAQRENPRELRRQEEDLGEGLEESRVQLEDPREGMWLRLMLDGRETVFEMGEAFNLPLEDFANRHPPAPMAWKAAEMAVENRHRQAVHARLREIAE